MSAVKESTCNAGDSGSIPGLGSSPGEGNGTLLQYSCLGNPWTEEPGALQSMGSQRVRHDRETAQVRMHTPKQDKECQMDQDSRILSWDSLFLEAGRRGRGRLKWGGEKSIVLNSAA